MKCIILAGGSGDRLWPLSRKHYPKQFMEVQDGRSLLQETVVRNMPFCDEFIIVTHVDYEFIVEGQMRAFQGLRYRCIYEECPRSTAAAIAMVSLLSNPSELLYVVASDTIIEGAEYRENVLRAMELAKKGYITLFGIHPDHADTRYGYIRHEEETVLSFAEKPSKEAAQRYVEAGGYLWNSGSLLMCAGDFVQELKKYQTALYRQCLDAFRRTDVSRANIWLRKEVWQQVDAVSVEKAVLEHSKQLRVIAAHVRWVDVDELEDVIPYLSDRNHRDIILEACDNVDIVNRTRRQLVVGNGLKDLMIVNTEDALYVAPKGVNADGIRKIMSEHQEESGHYFERNRIAYRHWGCYEVLSQDKGFKVKRVTIDPGQTIYSHMHDLRSEHWAIVSGSARITLDGKTKEYKTNESVYVPKGVAHEVSNPSEERLIIIETGIGETIAESDMIRVAGAQEKPCLLPAESISRLEPAYKDYLWGGSLLKEKYGKKCDYDIVAESWEMSAHPAGQSVLAEGRYRGMRFGDYLRRIGRECLGWKCQAYEEFPILIKFIDAKENLSVQVHPDDAYALSNEGEYGKNEMWHILQCEEGACLYCGFRQDVSKEQVSEAIAQGTILELLNKVNVKAGDTIFIPAGTVHAIGAGIVLCEIQQNSNSTYRIYDYGRRDKYGNERELHLDKAMQVMQLRKSEHKNICSEEPAQGQGFTRQLIGECKYFACTKYEIEEEAQLTMDESSFRAVVVLEGQGILQVSDVEKNFQKGDTFFLPAGEKKLHVSGNCQLIVTRI